MPAPTNKPDRTALRLAALLTLAALTAGCHVGPDCHEPQLATPEAWTGLEGGPGGGLTSTPTTAAPDITAWWQQFNDPTLTSLIEQASKENLTLAQAETRIRQARAARDVVASGLYPTVNASASASRAHSASTERNLFLAGFDASWEIDVFGGTQRAVEAADAQVQSAVFDSRSILVSLTGEVATTYLDLRGTQRQLAVARENLTAQQQTLDLTQQRFDAGYIGALDVANATAQSNQTASQIPLLDAHMRADIYTLDVLLGLPPGTMLKRLVPGAAITTPPGQVPVGLPSELLMRRPDVRRAESELHAATARIGVAVADQYPRFSLTGSLGLQGNQFASLGSIANNFWSIGPAVSVPLFTGGRTQANIELAKAAGDEAVLAYRSSLLTALQDVETALVNFTREQQRRESLQASTVASRQAVDLALQLYNNGRTDFLNVLTAQNQLRNIEASLAASETAVGTDLVALYKALGGGWNPQDVEPGPPSAASPAPVPTTH